jgi:hypothetical protein
VFDSIPDGSNDRNVPGPQGIDPMTPRFAKAACAALLLLFGALSYGSALKKSATFDEPVQAMAGWVRLHYGDFRLNFEDPPLWEVWASLLNGRDALKADFSNDDWKQMPDGPPLQWEYSARMLWATPGVDGIGFINRARFMMLLVALALGVLLAWWAWKLGGPLAAVVTLFLFALDPNFLAHASMVKNDVSVSLVLVGVAFLVWRNGQKVTRFHALALMLAVGAAANVKFSTALLAPIVIVLLSLRAAANQPWTVLDTEYTNRRDRLVTAAVIVLGIGGAVFVTIWALYGFRFAGTPEGRHLNFDYVWKTLRQYQTQASHGGTYKRSDLAAWQPDLVTRTLRFAFEKQLLPEAWIDGFLFIYASSLARTSFLFGQMRETGWWYYFPVAMLLKTPVATLLSIGGGAFFGVRFFRERRRPFDQWWTLASLTVPPGIYLASSMASHMNIGIRHVLPIYGFAYIGCGVVASAAFRRWGQPVLFRGGLLAAGLFAETALAAPNFIPFFNVVAGGPTKGIDYLSDSNLDWGQDLPLLAQWQQEHPKTRLYLSYFGMVDPLAYGIKYRPLMGNFQFGPQPDGKPMRIPSYFAVSANHLQGLSVGTQVDEAYKNLRKLKPVEILGGSIYIYEIKDEQTLLLAAPPAPAPPPG